MQFLTLTLLSWTHQIVTLFHVPNLSWIVTCGYTDLLNIFLLHYTLRMICKWNHIFHYYIRLCHIGHRIHPIPIRLVSSQIHILNIYGIVWDQYACIFMTPLVNTMQTSCWFSPNPLSVCLIDHVVTASAMLYCLVSHDANLKLDTTRCTLYK